MLDRSIIAVIIMLFILLVFVQIAVLPASQERNSNPIPRFVGSIVKDVGGRHLSGLSGLSGRVMASVPFKKPGRQEVVPSDAAGDVQ